MAYIQPFAGLNVHFSPFDDSLLALSTGENFGIAGKGQLQIFKYINNTLQLLQEFVQPDAIFDCAWSEHAAHHIATGNGKGLIQLYNLQTNKIDQSIFAFQGEVQSLQMNHKQPNLLLASGQNGQVKVFDIFQQKELEMFPAHQGIGYQINWHPKNPNHFASVGQDGFLKLWDLQSPQKNVMSFRSHDQEILTCDFNKYQDQIVTGSIDKTIKVWDLRNLSLPVTTLHNHRYPVRKVKCSPFEPNIVASGSYDMNVNIWDINHQHQKVLFQHRNHTEFVISLDFSLYNPRLIASTGYDGRLLVWPWDQPQPAI